MKSNWTGTGARWLLCGWGIVSAVSSTGCQLSAGGQTLPSPFYITDDVQYFAPDPEFKLSREAAAMKAYNAELSLEGK